MLYESKLCTPKKYPTNKSVSSVKAYVRSFQNKTFFMPKDSVWQNGLNKKLPKSNVNSLINRFIKYFWYRYAKELFSWYWYWVLPHTYIIFRTEKQNYIDLPWPNFVVTEQIQIIWQLHSVSSDKSSTLQKSAILDQ